MNRNVLFLIKPKCNVEFIEDDFSVRQTLEKMDHHHYSAIPILDKEGKYIGVLSEGDILWYAKRSNDFSILNSEKINIKEIKRMRDYKCCSIDSNVDELINIIFNQNFVPVVDYNNTFIGIVTRQDVLKELYNRK